VSARPALLLGLLTLAGCERGLHQMYDQPKYTPLAPSPLFADGASARPQVAGTVPLAAGALAAASSGRGGTLPGGQIPAANPLPVTGTLLARGRERFGIYCAPCHGAAGDGEGVIVQRGFPAPPSYHSEHLREAPDRHFYEVISDGYGAMYPYADRIAPDDRWAIIAYIRALQLSQHAPAALLGEADRQRLRDQER